MLIGIISRIKQWVRNYFKESEIGPFRIWIECLVSWYTRGLHNERSWSSKNWYGGGRTTKQNTFAHTITHFSVSNESEQFTFLSKGLTHRKVT
jgi:hypothetical protein